MTILGMNWMGGGQGGGGQGGYGGYGGATGGAFPAQQVASPSQRAAKDARMGVGGAMRALPTGPGPSPNSWYLGKNKPNWFQNTFGKAPQAPAPQMPQMAPQGFGNYLGALMGGFF